MAVVGAGGRERELEAEGVDERRLEVQQVAVQQPDLVLLRALGRGLPLQCVHLGELDTDLRAELPQAAGAFDLRAPGGGPGDEDALIDERQ